MLGPCTGHDLTVFRLTSVEDMAESFNLHIVYQRLLKSSVLFQSSFLHESLARQQKAVNLINYLW